MHGKEYSQPPRYLSRSERRGFTLIELLVVIAIIGILSGITIQQINGVREKARDAHRLTDMRTIEVALNAYIIDHNGILFDSQGPAEWGHTGRDGDGDEALGGDIGCWENTDFAGYWDRSSMDGYGDGFPFLPWLVRGGYLAQVPVDPLNDMKPGTDGCAHGNGHTYVFFTKPAGYDGCDPAKGKIFLLGISDMESRNGPYPGSPNFACGGMTYNRYYEWFDGIYEKDL